MKKKILFLGIVAILMLMLVILTGCGNKTNIDSTGSSNNEATEAKKVGNLSLNIDEGKNFSEGLAAVKKDGKWGYIDKQGNLVIEYKYEIAESFSEELALVYTDKKYGYIDTKGNTVIDFKYESANSFSGGLATVKENGKWLIIDNKGTIKVDNLSELGIDNITTKYSNGMLTVDDSNHNMGYIDTNGNLVIGFKYNLASKFSDEGIAFARDPQIRKNGFIDKKGKTLIDFKYQQADYFSEGLAAVQKVINGNWGYIDVNGNEMAFEYSYTYPFSEGLGRVKNSSKLYGYIDKSGKVVVEPQYSEAGNFKEKLAYVKKDGKYGFINQSGKVVIDCNYDKAKSFSQGLAYIEKDGKCGYINYEGKVIIGNVK